MSSIIRPRKSNQRPGRGQLFRAAEAGSLTRVAVLLVLGHNPDRPDTYGLTPLHMAVWQGHCRVASLLARHSNNINSKDMQGNTALHKAAFRNCTRCTKMLLSRSNSNSTDERGRTPLLIAVENGHKQTTELLLADGADVNAITDNGDNCLHLAAASCHALCVAQLVRTGGISINLLNRDGCTPLYLACLCWKSPHCSDTVRHLIAAGADLNIRGHSVDDFEYKLSTPFEVSAARGNFEVVVILTRAGCDVRMVENEWSVGINKPHYLPEDSQLFKWLLQQAVSPKSLKHQCRHTIRSKVGQLNNNSFMENNISNLPLPTNLKEYIRYSDLVQAPDVELPPAENLETDREF